MRQFVLLCLLAGPVVAQEDPAGAPPAKPAAPSPLHMLIKTSLGDVTVELFTAEAPETVKNFVELAEGKKEFVDPKTREKVKRPFFDGLIFHRVIKDFMIQGGCPLGTGTGSPGYKFKDEINAKALGLDKVKAFEDNRPHPHLLIRTQQDFQRALVMPLLGKLGITSQEELQKRQEEVMKALQAMTLMQAYENLGYEYDDKLQSHAPTKGTLAMANTGPNTNGSQFFISLVDNVHLTGKHTVFGRVVGGMDVVEKIGGVDVAAGAKPVDDVKIISIRKVKPA